MEVLVYKDLFGKVKASGKKKSIRDLVSSEELLKMYEQSWIDDWYQSKGQKEEYFKNGKEILKNFYQSDYLDVSQPSYLEKGFSIKINGYTLTGKIDRIDEFKEGLKIIDYKTGKPKEKLNSEDKEQLLIYQMASASLFDQPIFKLAYYYLENDTQVEFLGTDKEIKALQDKIVKTIDQIKDFDFAKFTKEHGRCQYCEGII